METVLRLSDIYLRLYNLHTALLSSDL